MKGWDKTLLDLEPIVHVGFSLPTPLRPKGEDSQITTGRLRPKDRRLSGGGTSWPLPMNGEDVPSVLGMEISCS